MWLVIPKIFSKIKVQRRKLEGKDKRVEEVKKEILG